MGLRRLDLLRVTEVRTPLLPLKSELLLGTCIVEATVLPASAPLF